MGQLYLGGFQDVASGFFVTASQVPSAQANMMLARLQSAVSLIITVAGVAFLYIIPALFIVKGLLATVPGLNNLVNKFGGGGMSGGGSGDGIIGYLTGNITEFLVGIIFALNAASGMWATEMGYFSEGMAALVQKVANGQWMSSDTPASITQFKEEVKIYSDKSNAAMYQSYLSKEKTMKDSLEQYVATQHPDNNDMNYVRQKAAYTAVVSRLQILSQKLTASNYAQAAGISDPNFYKQHLQADSAKSDQSGAFNPAFVQSSMSQSFGVSLPSASN